MKMKRQGLNPIASMRLCYTQSGNRKKKDKKPQDVQEETLHLTDEEKAFVKALDGKSYPMAKPRISQLKIDY